MRFLPLPVLLCLVLAACKPPAAPSAPPAAPTPSATASTAPVALQATPAAATPEQIGSTLRLRVAFGGLPPRDTAAALLHRDEVADPSLTRGKSRFALAWLKGWDEGQLRGNDVHLVIYRNKVDARGETESVPFPAALVRFDPATGLGIVAFTETFDYAADVGFHLRRDGDPARADLTLLRTRPDADPAHAYGRQAAARFAVDAGVYHAAGGSARVDWPAPHFSEAADPVTLAVSAPDSLHGFVETTPAGPAFNGLKGFALTVRFPAYEVAGVRFEDAHTQGSYEIALGITPGPDSPMPRQLRLHVHDTTTPAREEWPAPGTAAPPADTASELRRYAGPDPAWKASLAAPPEGEARVYAMQLSWPLLPGKDGLEIYGRPFRVRVDHRPGGLFPALLDPTLGTPEPSPADGATAFPLEAAALDVHLVGGGREALVRLDAAPYWKRFSFEKNDWLPLPDPAPSAHHALTGNLDALFVLDRELHEVRKYRLPDLEPAGAATLPPGEYNTILAGSDSAHAPVHVVAGNHLLSLDPDTLARCDIPTSADREVGPGFPLSALQGAGHYFTTGDGLAIVRLRDGAGDVLHYNGDAAGFERSYLGGDGAGNLNEVPGVSAGWSAAYDVRCLDSPDGPPENARKPAGRWKFAPGALSENAPVVFRLVRADANEIPPHARLGCFALFGTVPFAEVDVPELAGLVEHGLWNRDRWAFLDPYSQRLATLDFDRRTWRVRRLETVPERHALLNWPDTTLPRGAAWTFHPTLAGGGPLDASTAGQTVAPAVDPATGTVSLPAPAGPVAALRLLTLRLPVPDEASIYPVLLHTVGVETPFATAPGTRPAATGPPALRAGRRDAVPLGTTLVRLEDRVRTLVGPVAGYAALVTESGRVDFLSVETRRVVGSFPGAPGAAYYPGPGGLLEYDPARRTLTRVSVPDGRREATVALPANIDLKGIGAGTERGGAMALAVQVAMREGSQGLADLALRRKAPPNMFAFTTVAVLDGQTLKAGTRAQPVPLARLLGKPETFRDEFAYSIGVADRPPVLLPGSRDGTVFDLAGHLLVAGPSYAVAYPYTQLPGGEPVTSTRGGLAGGSLTGLMAFSGSGQAYKGGAPVPHNPASAEGLGSSADGLYQFYAVTIGPGETGMEVRSAEDDRPLLRLSGIAFAGQPEAVGGEHFARRVWSLGEHGPLAVLGASGLALELVDLDPAAVARQAAPQDFHVVSQPLPYVMEGRSYQYTVRVNNPAAVQGMRVISPSGALLGSEGTVSFTAPGNIAAPTTLKVSVEIRGKDGHTLTHEFPVCVLPTARVGAGKAGEL